MQNCGEQLRAGNETRDGWLNPKSFICVGRAIVLRYHDRSFYQGAEKVWGAEQ